VIDFRELAQTLNDVKVLVIGDVMLDRYIYGAVSRISPEAPVPVLNKTGEDTVLGGAGNVAANISALGGQVALLGAVGEDANAGILTQLCLDHGIDSTGVIRSTHHQTTVKTRFVSGGQQIVRLDEETAETIDNATHKAIVDGVNRQLAGTSIIVLSDYNKGLFHDTLAQDIISIGRKQNIPVIVDPKGHNYGRYKGATALTPNLRELAQISGNTLETDDDILNAARKLINQLELSFVLATRSERGMSLVKQKTDTHIPTRAQQVFDVSGAGDTVIASLSLALAAGLPEEGAAQFSNAAAAVAVSKRGTAQVTLPEVQSELTRRSGDTKSSGRVLNWKQAVTQIEHWKKDGLQIGFTNGCFDILHYGHVSLLERASQQCDKLIVGLNSDASVSRLKGPTRPINIQADRLAVLSALRSVDAVVLFEEDTPLDLISELEPDVLFKGADYAIEDVVGRELVEATGGKVVLLELEDGRSTTGVVKLIKSSDLPK